LNSANLYIVLPPGTDQPALAPTAALVGHQVDQVIGTWRLPDSPHFERQDWHEELEVRRVFAVKELFVPGCLGICQQQLPYYGVVHLPDWAGFYASSEVVEKTAALFRSGEASLALEYIHMHESVVDAFIAVLIAYAAQKAYLIGDNCPS